MDLGSQEHWFKELTLMQFEYEHGETFDDGWKGPRQ